LADLLSAPVACHRLKPKLLATSSLRCSILMPRMHARTLLRSIWLGKIGLCHAATTTREPRGGTSRRPLVPTLPCNRPGRWIPAVVLVGPNSNAKSMCTRSHTWVPPAAGPSLHSTATLSLPRPPSSANFVQLPSRQCGVCPQRPNYNQFPLEAGSSTSTAQPRGTRSGTPAELNSTQSWFPFLEVQLKTASLAARLTEVGPNR